MRGTPPGGVAEDVRLVSETSRGSRGPTNNVPGKRRSTGSPVCDRSSRVFDCVQAYRRMKILLLTVTFRRG